MSKAYGFNGLLREPTSDHCDTRDNNKQNNKADYTARKKCPAVVLQSTFLAGIDVLLWFGPRFHTLQETDDGVRVVIHDMIMWLRDLHGL